jgi:hypothetical protein
MFLESNYEDYISFRFILCVVMVGERLECVLPKREVEGSRPG